MTVTSGSLPQRADHVSVGLSGAPSCDHCAAKSFVIGWYGRHGSLRRLGHGGSGVGALAPGITGRTRLDGADGDEAIETVDVPAGTVWPKDQTGWVPLGAEIVTRRRDPAR